MSDEQQHRVNLRIPQELWRAVKKAAALEGKTLTILMFEWCLAFVRNTEEKFKLELLKKDYENEQDPR